MPEIYEFILISILINVVSVLGIGIIAYIIKTKITSDFEEEMEKLKADLTVKSVAKQEYISEKRKKHKIVIESMKGLYTGEGTMSIENFLEAYNTVLLWGSDDVIKKLTYFLHYYEEDSADNDKLTNILSETIIEMRKDLDSNNTKLTTKDIAFKVLNPN